MLKIKYELLNKKTAHPQKRIYQMAKLHFIHSTMNAGKSTQLLQTEFNYKERGMKCLLLTAGVDNRYGLAKITSRLGLSSNAHTFDKNSSLLPLIKQAKEDNISCILIDESQFLTETQVWELCEAVDEYGIPVMAYGLRTDFQGNLFEGSQKLMALADDIRELKTICHCGKKATMVIRMDETGKAVREGAQVQIGGNDTYQALCRKHWKEEFKKD